MAILTSPNSEYAEIDKKSIIPKDWFLCLECYEYISRTHKCPICRKDPEAKLLKKEISESSRRKFMAAKIRNEALTISEIYFEGFSITAGLKRSIARNLLRSNEIIIKERSLYLRPALILFQFVVWKCFINKGRSNNKMIPNFLWQARRKSIDTFDRMLMNHGMEERKNSGFAMEMFDLAGLTKNHKNIVDFINNRRKELFEMKNRKIVEHVKEHPLSVVTQHYTGDQYCLVMLDDGEEVFVTVERAEKYLGKGFLKK